MNILGIDLGSTQTCAIVAQKDEEGLKIIGFAKAKTNGVKKALLPISSLLQNRSRKQLEMQR